MIKLGNLVYERKTELKIMNPPSIRLEPERQSVQLGSSPTVTCTADSGDPPIQIVWSTETGQPLPARISQNNGVLQVGALSKNTIETKMCEAGFRFCDYYMP